MLIINVSTVSKNFGYGLLFRELSFSLNEGERISIVGANGCGKSTLLKMIAGLEKCDKGSINVKKGAKIAYLDQASPDRHDDRIVEEVLRDAYSDLFKIENNMNDILKKMESEKDTEEYERLIKHYGDLQERFQNSGGYNITTNIDIVCSGLKISNEIRLQNYDSLSGGEKTLIHLAKSLVQEPDILLLDEPTNHLDINKIEWLESYIKNYKGAVVIVSHDRSFLDNMSDKILEIDNGEGTIYSTNYTDYLNEKEKRFEKLITNWEEQQVYFKRLEDEAKRMAQAGMATNSTAMTRKASVIFNRLEREKAKTAIKRPVENKKLKIGFDELQKNSKRVIELKDLTVTTGERNIVDKADMFVSKGERIAMVGPNGSGKSAIIKTIVGEQNLPIAGEVIVSPSVKIGYLSQIIEFKDEKQPLLDYFREETGINEETSRSILTRFIFGQEDIFKRIGSLSGGERIRLRLAILLQQQINTLVFDEPTNHIDIPTKESLEEAIENFEGTILAVSHDRFFINKFAEKVVEVENGRIKTYLGNYKDYIVKKQIANTGNARAIRCSEIIE